MQADGGALRLHGTELCAGPIGNSTAIGLVDCAAGSNVSFSEVGRTLIHAGGSSHWRDCHFTDTPCLSLLKHLLKVKGGDIKMTVSPTARRQPLLLVRPRPGRWGRSHPRQLRDG